MSYQFEDDSALEELLNQQLDSRRRQPAIGARPTTGAGPTGSRPQAARPASSQLAGENRQPEVAEPTSQKSKLASWLDGGSKKPTKQEETQKLSLPSNQESLVFAVEESSPEIKTTQVNLNSDSLVLESLKEAQLREMSKQGLIRLLVSQVEPEMRSLNRKLTEQSQLREENETLQRKLAMEVERNDTLEEKQAERLRISELAWQQLNKQLESRLENREKELKELAERQSKLMKELENKHQSECTKLAENYQKRIEEEKRQFEDILRGREEFHKLELESKLKVNCELKQLETIFAEWNQMIQSTLSEFNGQHKQIESFLNKQTVQINSSNLELARRTKSLGEEYGTFVEQTSRLSKLAEQVELNLPRLMNVNESNEELVKRISDKLAEFVPLNEELRAQEQQIERLKDELRMEKERVAQERFQLGLDSNRLIYREERLNELEQLNEQTSQKLSEQLQAVDEREAQLRQTRGQFEVKGDELREQNYELHQNRKRLGEREEKLGELELKLKEKEREIEGEKRKALEEIRKLELVRDKARKELQQLRRLQKELVCSICLERLFKPGLESGQGESLREKVEFNLANFNHYFEADGKQLDEESQFVELLALSK